MMESNVLDVWRAEYIRNLNVLRVYARAPRGSTLLVLDAEGEFYYGKMSWAGGEYYVLSRMRVPEPGEKVVVEATFPDGTAAEADRIVVYRSLL